MRISYGLQERIWIVTIATTRMEGSSCILYLPLVSVVFLFDLLVIYLLVITHPHPLHTYRYNSVGNPAQEVFYFPLLSRLEEMYKDEGWRHSLTYPDKQPRGSTKTRTDFFDSLVYKRLRASAAGCKHFISFAHCADAVSANKRISRSILPVNLRCLLCECIVH